MVTKGEARRNTHREVGLKRASVENLCPLAPTPKLSVAQMVPVIFKLGYALRHALALRHLASAPRIIASDAAL